MPSITFANLPEDRREIIINAAIEEFSKNSYREASINQICKQSKMAKGSFYQYFSNKLDLYEFIMNTANQIKLEFFSTSLEEFPNLGLFEKIKFLYIKGIEFAYAKPLFAALGTQFSKETDEEAKKRVLNEVDEQAESFFDLLIEKAKEKGEIRKAVSTIAVGGLLRALNQSVYARYVEHIERMDYKGVEQELLTYVEDLMEIVANGVLEIRREE